MIPFIHCIRDGGYAVGIADNSYKRRAVTQCICHFASCALSQRTDHRGSRNQDLFPGFRLTEYAVRTDTVTDPPLVHGMLPGLVGHIGSGVHSRVGTIRFRMHHTFTYRYGSCAALAPQLVKSCRFWANAAVIGNVRSSHRRGKHAIAECNTSVGVVPFAARTKSSTCSSLSRFRMMRLKPCALIKSWLAALLMLPCFVYKTKATNISGIHKSLPLS